MLHKMLLHILSIIYILNRLKNSDTASSNMRNVGLTKVKSNYRAC